MIISKPIIYRSRQRWQFWTAFAGSILVHFGAVAGSWTKTTIPALGLPDDSAVSVTMESAELSPPEPPPPIDIPLPAPPPALESPEFPEDQMTVPKHPTVDTVRPLPKRKPATPIGATRMSMAKVAAINAPKPAYPYEARRQHITGSGVAVITINPLTGYVTKVSMRQSTGSAILDGATISTFERWRFTPGTVSEVLTPITFTLTGVQF